MKRKLIVFGVLLVLLIALPLTLIQVQKQQETRQRAEGLNNVYLELKPFREGKNAIDTQFVQTLYLQNPLNKDISGVDITLTYSKDHLDVIDFITEENLSYIVKDINISGEVHLVGINSRQTNMIDSSIPLGAFIFKAKKEGNGTIDFSKVTITATSETEPLVPNYNRPGSYEIGKELQSITPPAQTQINGDLNGEGKADKDDLDDLGNHYGETGGSFDLNNDGVVDGTDYNLLLRTTPALTPDPLLSMSPTPTPIPSLAPFISEVFPKEGPLGTMFTIRAKAPPKKNLNAKVKIPVQTREVTSSIIFALNDNGIADDGLHNYSMVINTSRGDFARNGVFEISYYESVTYPDGKWDSISFKNKDSFTITVKDPDICTAIVKNGESNKKIDVLFIANNYKENELESFKKDEIPKQMSAIFSKEPFSLNKDAFNIFFVRKVSNVDCNIKNFSQCTTQIRNIAYQNCPFFDKIIVIDKKDYREFADLGFWDVGIAIGTPKNTNVTVHEFGHAMGLLGDEYDMTHDSDVPRISTTDDYSSIGYQGYDDTNCSAFACPKWCSGKSSLEKPECSSFVDKKTCQDHKYNGIKCAWLSDSRECDYPYDKDGKLNFGQSCEQYSACYYGCGWGRNKYRSSKDSMMNTGMYKSLDFNTVSKKGLQKEIDRYTK